MPHTMPNYVIKNQILKKTTNQPVYSSSEIWGGVFSTLGYPKKFGYLQIPKIKKKWLGGIKQKKKNKI